MIHAAHACCTCTSRLMVLLAGLGYLLRQHIRNLAKFSMKLQEHRTINVHTDSWPQMVVGLRIDLVDPSDDLIHRVGWRGFIMWVHPHHDLYIHHWQRRSFTLLSCSRGQLKATRVNKSLIEYISGQVNVTNIKLGHIEHVLNRAATWTQGSMCLRLSISSSRNNMSKTNLHTINQAVRWCQWVNIDWCQLRQCHWSDQAMYFLRP